MPERRYLQGLLRQGRRSEDGIRTELGENQLISKTRATEEGRAAVSCSSGLTGSTAPRQALGCSTTLANRMPKGAKDVHGS